MPGTQIFTYFNVGKETVRGTPVAPTRQMYMGGTGVLDLDPHLNFHEGENRGVRTRIARATQMGEDVALQASTVSGVSYDDLSVVISQLKGGLTGAGAMADKTWTWQPSMTAANSPEAYSIDVGDDTQNWRIQYGMLKSFKLSAGLLDITNLDTTWFGQRAIKGAKAVPASNTGVKIPGDLWTVKYAATQAGLAGASISTNFLLDWELDVDTGLIWRHYMDGNLYGAQHVETDISGTLSMTVESTALAVSEFYDKWYAQTLDFVRLKATGPVLGATNYSCLIDVPILYSKVEPIGGEEEGINLYKVQANLAYDPTSAFSIQGVLVNSLAALP
jgi:hypothetical protein